MILLAQVYPKKHLLKTEKMYKLTNFPFKNELNFLKLQRT